MPYPYTPPGTQGGTKFHKPGTRNILLVERLVDLNTSTTTTTTTTTTTLPPGEPTTSTTTSSTSSTTTPATTTTTSTTTHATTSTTSTSTSTTSTTSTTTAGTTTTTTTTTGEGLSLALDIPDSVVVGEGDIASVSGVGFDIEDNTLIASVLWEVEGQQPSYGTSLMLLPGTSGTKRVDVEVLFIDGRRLFASGSFASIAPVNAEIEDFFADPSTARVWYSFDEDYAADAGGTTTFTPAGAISVDNASWVWPSRPSGGALVGASAADYVTANISRSAFLPMTGQTLMTMEAMVCLRSLPPGDANVSIMYLEGRYNAYMGLRQFNGSGGLYFACYNGGGSDVLANNSVTVAALTLNEWHHIKIVVTANAYTAYVDGTQVGTLSVTGALSLWDNSTADVRMGGIDGWTDELILHST